MAKNTNQPKKHHYVPCMLLSQFGTGDGRSAKVWVWDKETGRVWNARADSVAYQNDLYKIPTERLELLDEADIAKLPPELQGEYAIEAMFGMMEKSLAYIIKVMQSTLTVPPEGSEALIELLTAVTLFDMRTPAKMEQARQMTEALMNLMAEVNFPDFTDEQRVSVPFKSNRPQLLATVLQHLPDVMEFMLERHWSLRIAQDNNYILTDFPVQHVFARTPLQRWDVPAPAVKNTIAMFPLTRSLLLVGEYEVSSGVRLADARWVGFHNANALGHAERFLFTFEDKFTVLANERGLPAYTAIYNSDERLFTMTPQWFAQEVKAGHIGKPQRMTINGVAPEDYRLDTPMKAANGFNPTPQTQVMWKHTFLNEEGEEVPLSELHEKPKDDD